MLIDPKIILQLRQETGAGFQDCQKALEETSGNMEKAIQILRIQGSAKAGKKQARSAAEGLIHAYVHNNGKVGVLIEVNCETDFVARNEEFRELVHDIAMQVAATNPSYLRPDDISSEILEKEKDIWRQQLSQEGKPPEIVEKALQGRLAKYYAEVCLLKQQFIKDETIDVETLIQQKIAKIGEKIEIKRFIRFAIGE